MNIKLTPLIIFLLLLFLLIFTIIYRNEFNGLFPEKWNISEAIFSNNDSNWYKSEGYEDSFSTYKDASNNVYNVASIPPLNVKPVYDISKSIVKNPKKGKIYYDSSGQPLNFPKDDVVYDEIGNIITSPPIVGLMTDYAGNPMNLPLYDVNGKEIVDFANFYGPIYDSYHNQIQFPYLDSDGNYGISPIMTPSIFQQYMDYMKSMNNSTRSDKHSDISCAFGCVNYDQPLDNYISDYYQHFWNQYKQMYSDDHILKSSVPVIPITHCNNATNWNAIYNTSNLGNKRVDGSGNFINEVGETMNNIGDGTQKFVTAVGKNTQAVVAEVGDTIGDIGGGAQKFATTVGGNVKAVVDEVGDTIGDIGGGAQKFATTVGGDIKAVGSAIGGGVNSALTTTPTSVQGQYNTISAGGAHAASNSRGLAGNYGGDNGVNNMGYMKGANQFSTYSATDGVANYGNNYNAKPAQSSDFMPITTDFSKFGR
jgi:hypothetical protein